MPSSLTWIDHDAEAQKRSLRILALFSEKESRDELGLGGIRDSIADALFPGTSTIQTRLRYMLFIPWMYKELEKNRVPARDIARRADQAERDLIDVMRIDDREVGFFGSRAGRNLKRLPSSIYWAGLRAWGILTRDWAQDQYHRSIDYVYRCRKEEDDRGRERRSFGDTPDQAPLPATITWHLRLPAAPSDFPAHADFALTSDEADFLLDCIVSKQRSSLLAHLALYCKPAEVSAPWEHPELAGFTDSHRELLDHARRFSMLMHGAALVYNLALAEKKPWTEKVEEFRNSLALWFEELNQAEFIAWSLPRFWELTLGRGHAITLATRRFVEEWRQHIMLKGTSIVDDSSVRKLIRDREKKLKGTKSRFLNQQALSNWTGSSGLNRMTFRWSTASRFLKDIYTGLHRGETN